MRPATVTAFILRACWWLQQARHALRRGWHWLAMGCRVAAQACRRDAGTFARIARLDLSAWRRIALAPWRASPAEL